MLAKVHDVRGAATASRAREGIVYGDPHPEVLVRADTGELALVDWGTPSVGPLLHDVAAWLVAYDHSDPADRRSFLAAYDAHVPLTDAEIAALPTFEALVHTIAH